MARFVAAHVRLLGFASSSILERSRRCMQRLEQQYSSLVKQSTNKKN